MTAPVLAVDGLGIAFGAIKALDGVELDMDEGASWGVVGANGSGKTTLLNVISGLYRPTAGAVTFRGTDVTRQRPHSKLRAGLARTFQHPQLSPDLSILDNVLIGAERKNARRRNPRDARGVAEDLLDRVGLAEFADHLPPEVPFGMQKLAEVARALLSEPGLLLLDEPAAGLNQTERESLADLIRLHCQERGSVAILLIEHDLEFVRRLCRNILAMEAGRVIDKGSADAVLDGEPVRRSLLGEVAETHQIGQA